MAEVNKGPLSTILIYNDSTVRARERGGGQITAGVGSYAGLIVTAQTLVVPHGGSESAGDRAQVTASGSRRSGKKTKESSQSGTERVSTCAAGLPLKEGGRETGSGGELQSPAH